MKNRGVIIQPKDSDFISGVNSPIVWENRVVSGNWTQFRSAYEIQRSTKTDMMCCVSEGTAHSWEEQANWMLVNNLWPADALKFWIDNGYIQNGKFEISVRALAKMSGTSDRGTSNQDILDVFHPIIDPTVPNSIPNRGIIPRSLWSDPSNLAYTWNDFYSPIPQNLLDLAKQSLNYFTLLYEVVTNLKNELLNAPIIIDINTCSWEGQDITWCGASGENHCIVLDNIEQTNWKDVEDSYPPYGKRLAPDYVIPYAVKAVLYPVKNQPVQPIVKPPLLTQDVMYGDVGDAVVTLKNALHCAGWLLDVSSIPDIYGDVLAKIVFNFQKANYPGIWWLGWLISNPCYNEMFHYGAGNWVGPAYRQIINQIISNK